MTTYRIYEPRGKKDQYLTEFPYLSVQRLLVLLGAHWPTDLCSASAMI